MLRYLEKKIYEQPANLLTYAQFINIALYDETYGYYMKPEEKIGTAGDFITASNFYNVYGEIVAKWYAQKYQSFGLEPIICEIGGGNGRFAAAFIEAWQQYSDEKLTYYIVETSPYHLKLQREILPVGKEVIQVSKITEVAPFSGLVFSNELYDALPVHVVKKESGKLYELMVGIENGQLFETKKLLTNEQILSFLNKYNYKLQDGQTIEIPLAMKKMIRDVASSVEKGLLITVDYGYTVKEWSNPSQKDGSLRGYYRHQLMTNVLQHVGEMDITSHVHFDPFIHKGEKHGLALVTKQKLNEFLLNIGILTELENHSDNNPFSAVNRRNRAIRSLIMSGMSEKFDVIIQQKNCELEEKDIFKKDLFSLSK